MFCSTSRTSQFNVMKLYGFIPAVETNGFIGFRSSCLRILTVFNPHVRPPRLFLQTLSARKMNLCTYVSNTSTKCYNKITKILFFSPTPKMGMFFFSRLPHSRVYPIEVKKLCTDTPIS